MAYQETSRPASGTTSPTRFVGLILTAAFAVLLVVSIAEHARQFGAQSEVTLEEDWHGNVRRSHEAY